MYYAFLLQNAHQAPELQLGGSEHHHQQQQPPVDGVSAPVAARPSGSVLDGMDEEERKEMEGNDEFLQISVSLP